MGLFGLGVPELALVAGAAALLFGESACKCRYDLDICWMMRQEYTSVAALHVETAQIAQMYVQGLICSPVGPAKIPQLGQALGKTAKSVKAAADVRLWWHLVMMTIAPFTINTRFQQN